MPVRLASDRLHVDVGLARREGNAVAPQAALGPVGDNRGIDDAVIAGLCCSIVRIFCFLGMGYVLTKGFGGGGCRGGDEEAEDGGGDGGAEELHGD